MKKEEAKVTPRVNKWCQNWLPQSTPFDVKHTRGKDRFDLREIYDHQLDYMLAATTDHGFSFKIEDAGYCHPPCDTVMYKKAKYAGFVIVFPEFTCYLRATVIEQITTPSITENYAKKMCEKYIRNDRLPT